MTNQCCTIQSRFDVVSLLEDEDDVFLECLRVEGHVGPHLIKRHPIGGGEYVLWQTDICTEYCPDCQSEDPEDSCLQYREITEYQALEYISNPCLIGKGWER